MNLFKKCKANLPMLNKNKQKLMRKNKRQISKKTKLKNWLKLAKLHYKKLFQL